LFSLVALTLSHTPGILLGLFSFIRLEELLAASSQISGFSAQRRRIPAPRAAQTSAETSRDRVSQIAGTEHFLEQKRRVSFEAINLLPQYSQFFHKQLSQRFTRPFLVINFIPQPEQVC
jgi:hypothetical protein